MKKVLVLMIALIMATAAHAMLIRSEADVEGTILSLFETARPNEEEQGVPESLQVPSIAEIALLSVKQTKDGYPLNNLAGAAVRISKLSYDNPALEGTLKAGDRVYGTLRYLSVELQGIGYRTTLELEVTGKR